MTADDFHYLHTNATLVGSCSTIVLIQDRADEWDLDGTGLERLPKLPAGNVESW